MELTGSDRDCLGRLAHLWQNSPLAIERSLAATFSALASYGPKYEPSVTSHLRVTDEVFLRQEAAKRQTHATDMRRAAEIVHALLQTRESA